MKKILAIVSIALFFQSCTQDLKDNNPSFQGKLNNNYWRADYAEARSNGSGGFTITAYTPYEEVTLGTTSTNAGTYNLGTTNQDNFASYYYDDEEVVEDFETSIVYGPAFKVSIVNGGTGYVLSNSATTFFDNPQLNPGAGLRLATQVNTNGRITAADIVSRGDNYKAGDVVKVTGGNSNAQVKILSTQNSNGEVKIESVDGNTLTGTFKFTASDSEGNTVTISEGIFYRIPIVQY